MIVARHNLHAHSRDHGVNRSQMRLAVSATVDTSSSQVSPISHTHYYCGAWGKGCKSDECSEKSGGVVGSAVEGERTHNTTSGRSYIPMERVKGDKGSRDNSEELSQEATALRTLSQCIIQSRLAAFGNVPRSIFRSQPTTICMLLFFVPSLAVAMFTLWSL